MTHAGAVVWNELIVLAFTAGAFAGGLELVNSAIHHMKPRGLVRLPRVGDGLNILLLAIGILALTLHLQIDGRLLFTQYPLSASSPSPYTCRSMAGSSSPSTPYTYWMCSTTPARCSPSGPPSGP